MKDREDKVDAHCYMPNIDRNGELTVTTFERPFMVASYSPFKHGKVVEWAITRDQMALFHNFSCPTKDELKLFIMLYSDAADSVMVAFEMEGYRERKERIRRKQEDDLREFNERLSHLPRAGSYQGICYQDYLSILKGH